jgi:transcriptional regulator with AAA-type ATPase domain
VLGTTRLLVEARRTPTAITPTETAPTVVAREVVDDDPATAPRAASLLHTARVLQRLEWTFADLGDTSLAAEPMLDLALNLTGRRAGWFGRFRNDGDVETLADLDLSDTRRPLPLARPVLDDARRLGRPHLLRLRGSQGDDELLLIPLGNGDAMVALAAVAAEAPPPQEALRLAQGFAAVAWQRLCEVTERARLRDELQQLRFTLTAAHGALLGSTRLQPVRGELRRKADDGEPLLLTGEHGCELEELARYTHAESHRRAAPFLAWDATASPAALHERELCGADGLVQRAAGGSLLVRNADAVAAATLAKAMQLAMQPAPGRAAVVVLAASHLPAEKLLATPLGGWLAHRRVDVPPLRQQPGDVLVLTELFLAELGPGPNGAPRTLTERAKRLLATYAWPGNVHELRQAIETAAAQAGDQPIAPRHLPPTIPGEAGIPADVPTLEEVERAHIVDVLQRTGGNRSRSAQLLGIAVSTLYEKLRRYRIDA